MCLFLGQFVVYRLYSPPVAHQISAKLLLRTWMNFETVGWPQKLLCDNHPFSVKRGKMMSNLVINDSVA